MGEQAASRTPQDVLVTIGLGSCIGLALLDRSRGVAGLAHIVLPDSTGIASQTEPAKFADTAVPALLNGMARLGAGRSQLEAVLVGGAQMFAFGRKDGAGLDIGTRNEQATRAALERAGILIRAAATGGGKGRTVRVHVESGIVTVREAGGTEIELVTASQRRRPGG